MCLIFIFLDFDLEFFEKFIAEKFIAKTSGALKWQLKVLLTLCQLNFGGLRVFAQAVFEHNNPINTQPRSKKVLKIWASMYFKRPAPLSNLY